MWHPHRSVFIYIESDVAPSQGWFYSESYRCEQVPRNTDVAPSQGWFYSESYRCEQVPRNTDVSPSEGLDL